MTLRSAQAVVPQSDEEATTGRASKSFNKARHRNHIEPHSVKRTVNRYKVFPASSHELLAAFYAVRQIACFSIGVKIPRLC